MTKGVAKPTLSILKQNNKKRICKRKKTTMNDINWTTNTLMQCTATYRSVIFRIFSVAVQLLLLLLFALTVVRVFAFILNFIFSLFYFWFLLIVVVVAFMYVYKWWIGYFIPKYKCTLSAFAAHGHSGMLTYCAFETITKQFAQNTAKCI